jgi:hypothetical protein
VYVLKAERKPSVLRKYMNRKLLRLSLGKEVLRIETFHIPLAFLRFLSSIFHFISLVFQAFFSYERY